jgi:hypothetical protein
MTTTNRRTPIPMPDDMRSALQRVADADGRSMAYVAREAIAALLDGREPGWRAGREPVASSAIFIESIDGRRVAVESARHMINGGPLIMWAAEVFDIADREAGVLLDIAKDRDCFEPVNHLSGHVRRGTFHIRGRRYTIIAIALPDYHESVGGFGSRVTLKTMGEE